MKIAIPDEANELLNAIEQAGYEAWLVGGCVRDSLLARPAQDWDIASAATPQQLAECLRAYTVIPSGLRHGTVTVLAAGQRYEVTTFRSDGNYSDHRRPDSVTFGSSLAEDLARRDFTVNAMAYHPVRGLADYYGGLADIRQLLIRAVGEPDKRFNEDGLRIMRALRFAATLGFTVEPATAASIQRNRGLLQYIAAERLQTELLKLLGGTAASQILRDFPEVIGEFSPVIPARPRSLRQWLNSGGEARLRCLLALQHAYRPAQVAEATACLERVLAEEQLRMLAVNGRDMLALGLPPGPGIGQILNGLLRLVIEGELANERKALLAKAEELVRKNL